MTHLKIGAAILGAGGVAGGGCLVYPYVFPKSKKTILDELKSRNKTLITNNESQWILKKTLYDKSTNNFKVSIGGIEKTTITVDELKKWCSERLKESYSREKDFILSKVEKWCLKPNIKEALSKESNELIPLEGNSVDNRWGTKLSTNNDTAKGELVDKWGLVSSVSNGNTVESSVLRGGCKQKIEEEYIGDSHESYTLVKKWCLVA